MTPTQSRTAADLMVRDIVTTTPEATVREALDLMSENHVSGLPVLDRRDVCVGVISASDILLLEQEHASHEEETLGSWFNADQQLWEHVRVASDDENLDDVQVHEIMSGELVCVAPTASMQEVARLMVSKDVHRILVLDDARRLLGIVAAFDFVRVVASDAD